MNNRTIDRQAFEVTDLNDETDKSYWHRKSVDERMEHLQRLRMLNYGDRIPRRLVRVLEVVDRSPGWLPAGRTMIWKICLRKI